MGGREAGSSTQASHAGQGPGPRADPAPSQAHQRQATWPEEQPALASTPILKAGALNPEAARLGLRGTGTAEAALHWGLCG